MKLASSVLCSFRLVRNCLPAAAAFCLLFSMAVGLDCKSVHAQAVQAAPAQAESQKQFFPVSQMPLTEKQIQCFLAANTEVNEITDNAGEDIDKLAPGTVAKLDVVTKKHGLANYLEYKQIDANIGLVESGFDDVTRRYVGREALIKLRISRVKSDKKMSAESRTERLTELNDQFQFALPVVQYKGNIDIVAKYFDRLTAAARGD
jgi:hypothetical protein